MDVLNLVIGLLDHTSDPRIEPTVLGFFIWTSLSLFSLCRRLHDLLPGVLAPLRDGQRPIWAPTSGTDSIPAHVFGMSLEVDFLTHIEIHRFSVPGVNAFSLFFLSEIHVWHICAPFNGVLWDQTKPIKVVRLRRNDRVFLMGAGAVNLALIQTLVRMHGRLVVLVYFLGTLTGRLFLKLRSGIVPQCTRLDRLELLGIAILLEGFLHEDVKCDCVAAWFIGKDLGSTSRIPISKVLLALLIEAFQFIFAILGRFGRLFRPLIHLLRLQILRAM